MMRIRLFFFVMVAVFLPSGRRKILPVPLPPSPAAQEGREMMNVVPLPGALSASMKPLCLLITPYAMESPRPVPWPGSFVVKKGSKIWGRCSRSIPFPVSVMITLTLSAADEVVILSLPPFSFIASAALMNRLRNTCSRREGSPFTSGRFSAKRVSTSMPWKMA